MAASPTPRALLTAATRPVSLLVLLGSADLGWGLDVAALPAIGALAFTALVAFWASGRRRSSRARTTSGTLR